MEKENNKLIAEFDEVNMYNIERDALYSGGWMGGSLLKYDVSWSWLKPVVDKIEIKNQGVPQQLLHLSLFSTLDEVYNAVVEYITFYNEQNK